MRADTSAAPILLLGALIAGLVVQSVLPISRPAPLVVSMASAKKISTANALVSPSPVADDPAILLHPLFNATRSPPDGAGGEPAAPAGVFMLVGVASTGATASAILRDAAGALRTLRLGESLDGWRLTAVGSEGAIVSLGGRTQSLRVGAPPTLTGAAPAPR